MGKVTYKQLADELGVSKDKVKYQARKLPPEATEKVDGIVYLTELGAAQIRKALGVEPSQAVPELQQSDPVVAVLQNTLDLLQKQLEEKDKMIADLTAANKELTEANRELATTIRDQVTSLNGAQALHAGTIQKQLTDGSGAKKWRWPWQKGE